MEDEGFVDDSFIEQAAWEYIASYGGRSVAVLRSLAEAAELSGDALAAQTWRAIAETAGGILGIVVDQ